MDYNIHPLENGNYRITMEVTAEQFAECALQIANMGRVVVNVPRIPLPRPMPNPLPKIPKPGWISGKELDAMKSQDEKDFIDYQSE